MARLSLPGKVVHSKFHNICPRSTIRYRYDLPKIALQKKTVIVASLSSPTQISPPRERKESLREISIDAVKSSGLGIVDFLKGRCLLVTGATGFVGKVLIEKILRVAPEVGKIYVLIQAKDNEAARARLTSEVINSELFKLLREIHGEEYHGFMEQKIIPVAGNVREHDLGLAPESIADVVSEVDVFVNFAANTTFDERYDVALDINTLGPCRTMTLAKRCEKVELFVHVSTAYVNGEREGRILEKPFSMGDTIASETSEKSTPKLDVEEELRLAAELGGVFKVNDVAQEMKDLGLERARMHGWQNTYAFTKAMGEMVVNSMRGDIPVVTIRPSVVESTYREPFPGWIEGSRMMDPFIIYYGKGQLTGIVADPEGVLDVIPVDMVVNAMLAAMAKHGVKKTRGIHTYHVASSVVNPLIFSDLFSASFSHFTSFPMIDSFGTPILVNKVQLFLESNDFFSHAASVLTEQSQHSALTLSLKKVKRLTERYLKQFDHLVGMYRPYIFYAGRFDNANIIKLMEEMSEEERKAFGFDVGEIRWRDYISSIHIPGLRRHVLKGKGDHGIR